MAIPGLLQTPDFTFALINGANPGLATDVVERRMMARQQILTSANPLHYHAIIDEAILERPVGTSTIMRNQHRGRPTGRRHNRPTQQQPPEAGTLFFTRTEMHAWIKGCKAGEFDDLR